MKAQPSNKEINTLCSCVGKKSLRKDGEISKARDGSIKSEEEKFLVGLFVTPFREAFIACGDKNILLSL